MTDTFQALCARMADKLDHYYQLLLDDQTHALATEARAALAEPAQAREINWPAHFIRQAATQEQEIRSALAEPQPPAAGEVGELIAALRDQHRWVNLTDAQVDRAADLLERLALQPPADGEQVEPTDEELRRFWSVAPFIAEAHGGVAFARAVLARWGRPDPQPIPVSERKPGPEDCDSEGRCWCWDPATDEGIDDGVPSWEFCHWEQEHTHWLPAFTQALPAHALPVPEVQP